MAVRILKIAIMRNLIVFRGDKNAGKTTALRCVLESLLYLGGRLVSYKSYNKVRGFSGDFEAVIEYNGMLVAVCSMGDVPTAVPKYVKKYGTSCDIIITATRNNSIFTNRIISYNPQYFDKRINANDSPEKQYMDLADLVRRVVASI